MDYKWRWKAILSICSFTDLKTPHSLTYFKSDSGHWGADLFPFTDVSYFVLLCVKLVIMVIAGPLLPHVGATPLMPDVFESDGRWGNNEGAAVGMEEAQIHRMDEAERSLHCRFSGTVSSQAKRTVNRTVGTPPNLTLHLVRLAVGGNSLDQGSPVRSLLMLGPHCRR